MSELPRARSAVRSPWLWTAVAALAVAAAVAWWWGQRRDDGALQFRTAKIERGTITASVSASGTLNAVVTVQVGSEISGKIKELFADFNSVVKKGQLIGRIDPESFELRVRQAQAEREAAQTNLLNQQANLLVLKSQLTRSRITLAEASSDLERKQSLSDRGFISGAELDKARFTRDGAAEALRTAEAQIKVGETQVANAAAILKQRDASLAAARVDLERTAIRAPVDGIVISRNVDAGQTVAASLQAPTLFTIAQDLQQMQVDTAIDESDIGRIRAGQSTTFTVDAFPGRTYRGEVAQIRKAAQTVQNVVTYIVVVRTSNPDLSLFPGMTANVRIVTDSREGVLKVPNAALRFRPPATIGPPAASMQPQPTPGSPPGGVSDGQARRQHLVESLKLDAAQQARLDEILADSRQRFAELRDAPESDRRARAERARAEARQRIGAILTPDQQTLYAEIVAQETGRSGGTGSVARIYVVGDAGKPRELAVRLGLSDGNSTAVTGSSIAEGMDVIVGTVDRTGGAPRAAGGSAPRLPF